MYPPSTFLTKPCNSKTTKWLFISEILFLTISDNTDSETGIVPKASNKEFSESFFLSFFFFFYVILSVSKKSDTPIHIFASPDFIKEFGPNARESDGCEGIA